MYYNISIRTIYTFVGLTVHLPINISVTSFIENLLITFALILLFPLEDCSHYMRIIPG